MFNARNLIDLWSVTLNLYGLLFVAATLAMLLWLKKYCRKNSYDEELAIPGTLALIGGMAVGARVVFVIAYAPHLLADPFAALSFWKGGMSFHGGLLGMLAGGYWFARAHRWSPSRLADGLVAPVFFFLALGRIVNFLNNEIYGTVTSLPWCVEFATAVGCRHPVQLYDAALLIMLACVLIFVKQKSKFAPGRVAVSTLIAYTILRFCLDFLREASTLYLGIRAEHMLGFLTIAGLFILLYRLSVQKRPLGVTSGAAHSPQ